MNTMPHTGYTAQIEFDERDNIFVGRVLGLRTLISFHGETVTQLRSEFKAAIEDFLADNKKQGIAPEKPASAKMLLRVPPGEGLKTPRPPGEKRGLLVSFCFN